MRIFGADRLAQATLLLFSGAAATCLSSYEVVDSVVLADLTLSHGAQLTDHVSLPACDEDGKIVYSAAALHACFGGSWSTFASTACGDGVLDANEECDDGNVADGDLCSPTCTLYCGNGEVENEEECDDGNSEDINDDCSNLCVTNYCGDGVANNGEECDDGNEDDNDDCSNTCTTISMPGAGTFSTSQKLNNLHGDLDLQFTDANPAGEFVEIAGSHRMGRGVAVIAEPDANQDGIPDLIVSKWHDADKNVYIFQLGIDGKVDYVKAIAPSDIGAGDVKGLGLTSASLGNLDADASTVEIVIGHRDADRAYILSLSTSYEVTDAHELTPGTTANFDPQTDYQYTPVVYGQDVAAIGDMDGDGVQDVAIADAYADGDVCSSCGVVFLIFLNTDKSVQSYLPIGSSDTPAYFSATGFNFATPQNSRFGRGMASLGDLDGNGTPDLAVASDNLGSVFVLLMKKEDVTNKPIVDSFEHFPSTYWTGIPGATTSTNVGFSMTALDLKNDGVTKLIVGTFLNSGFFVVSLNSDGTAGDTTLVTGTDAGTDASTGTSSLPYGMGHGDINGDGVPDLVLGSHQDDEGPSSNYGAVHVLFQDPVPS